jgi:hypothetical protein
LYGCKLWSWSTGRKCVQMMFWRNIRIDRVQTAVCHFSTMDGTVQSLTYCDSDYLTKHFRGNVTLGKKSIFWEKNVWDIFSLFLHWPNNFFINLQPGSIYVLKNVSNFIKNVRGWGGGSYCFWFWYGMVGRCDCMVWVQTTLQVAQKTVAAINSNKDNASVYWDAVHGFLCFLQFTVIDRLYNVHPSWNTVQYSVL